MEKEQRVLDILKEMIAIDSETNTAKEVDMEKYLQKKLSSMGDMVKVSLMRVPNDPAGRSVVCGFIPGRKKTRSFSSIITMSSVQRRMASCGMMPFLRTDYCRN